MACEARAEIGFVVSAANLQDQSGNLASTRGLVLLVVDTVGSGFTTNVLPTSPLSVGSFLTGSGMPTNDLIVGAWDLSSLSTQGQLIAYTIISYSPPIAASQAVALYWFPSLTLASTTAGPGTPFGFYTDPVGIDGSAPWVLPVDGANPAGLAQLNFYTASRGGSNSNTTGQASYTTLTFFQVWQIQYFGSTTNSSAQPDADPLGKGMSNTNQFLAGFNPTNSAAYLHIGSVATSNNNVIVTYLGASGDTNWSPGFTSRTNVLDVTTGDASGNYTNGGWQDTGQTNILSGGNGSGSISSVTDTIPSTPTNRYYRVRVLLP